MSNPMTVESLPEVFYYKMGELGTRRIHLHLKSKKSPPHF